jgi:type I restriction-modification system DNA methylase subunit
MLDSYLKRIAEITKRGDAREESYYRPLADFLEEFSSEKRKKKVYVTSLPKKTEAGNPDFRVWDGKHSIVGYIEAKQPNTNLDDAEDTKQLERYIGTFPNLILTNFYEFRLYRNGQRIASVLLARPFIPAKLKTVPPAERESEFIGLLEKFFEFSRPKKFTAETLAKELATLTRFLREEVIAEQLAEEHSKGSGTLLGFYEAFRQHLIADLTHETFADLYAQTLTYGLFAARTRSENGFNRKLAYDLIPKTIGILRDIFRFISLEEPPPQLEWVVDDIAEVLAAADVKNILHIFFKEGKGADPIFHFYETFLAHYNPEERERRGVYYTPEPVVSYIVRSLNILLKEKFGRADGFATPSVTVLDPAGGTLTFIAEAAKVAMAEFEKYGKGSRSKFVEDHILKNFYSFELMMAPYAAGHLKMSFLLEELGHKLTGDERFQFYLTNTLEMEELAQTSLPGMSSLSEESRLAGRVKKQALVLVVLGNPPYSGHSVNRGRWITEHISTYKFIDGKPLVERTSKWLQDDYVKFIRFAQWKIDQLGEGILGFITNHSYLDNPTFRGMRQSLMNSFDEIYALDLHGNLLKKEIAPDGSVDENVFDIQQGVSIGLFVKTSKRSGQTKVYHSNLWGLREKKYAELMKADVEATGWKILKPASPHYLFVPRTETLLKFYVKYPALTDLFPINGVGITTARDGFVTDLERDVLLNRIRLFKQSKLDDEELHKSFRINTKQGWSIRKAWVLLQDIETSDLGSLVQPILYRPFDTRWLFYHGAVVWRTVKKIMANMMPENLGLISTRFVFRKKEGFHHAFVTAQMIDINHIHSPGTAQLFPLYLYPDTNKRDLFDQQKLAERVPNIAPGILDALEDAYGTCPKPEDILHYIYGILYSNAYRTKYSEFLKTDFPRVPFASSLKVFSELARKGEELVALHLLKSKQLAKPIAAFVGDGDNKVVKVTYNPKNSRVYINPLQYFTGVKPDLWDYHIGGYQVAEKWLKDRKGRMLSSEEVMHYCRVITALSETIKIQGSLDELFEKVEKSVLDMRAQVSTVKRSRK